MRTAHRRNEQVACEFARPSDALVGFLVNPVAGMGGRVGFKGTDGKYEEAIRLGAEPISFRRAAEFLRSLHNKPRFLTCEGPMGEDAFRESGEDHRFSVVYRPAVTTTADDTKRVCRIFAKDGADIVVFCGGDGTARDVYDVLKADVPILGIPAGVKMLSGVFGITPEATASVLDAFLSDETRIEECEVVDLDEEEYREGRIDMKLYGYARVPVIPELVQSMKGIFHDPEETTYKKAIGSFVMELVQMDPDALYILGPGSTVNAVASALGVDKTLLGVDLYAGGRIIASDVGEREILATLREYSRAHIIVTPIGSQGFIFGRGNQQISPEVIRRVGPENVMIVATPRKLRSIAHLRVDTGDPELDLLLRGYMKVISGYHNYVMKKVQ